MLEVGKTKLTKAKVTSGKVLYEITGLANLIFT